MSEERDAVLFIVMFLSVFEIFKQGVGPSSSHTTGPMVAANRFRAQLLVCQRAKRIPDGCSLRCVLKGALAFTGKGHGTDRAVVLGLHGSSPASLVNRDIEAVLADVMQRRSVELNSTSVSFLPASDIIFDFCTTFSEHPNGMVLELVDPRGEVVETETYFSIGGGFGAVKAHVAASLALRGNGSHFASLDACIQAMKETGVEMSSKFKETALGGLAIACAKC